MSNMDENQTVQNTRIVSDAETTAAAQRLLENIENTLVEPTALDAPAAKSAPQEVTPNQPEEDPTVQREYTDENLPVTPTETAISETNVPTFDYPSAESEFTQETTTYTLQPGDTLWDAAKAIDGSDKTDLRDIVHRIEVDPANSDALRGGLQPGQQLVVPVRIVGH
jgi:nucleoid-associated protein YgaU